MGPYLNFKKGETVSEINALSQRKCIFKILLWCSSARRTEILYSKEKIFQRTSSISKIHPRIHNFIPTDVSLYQPVFIEKTYIPYNVVHMDHMIWYKYGFYRLFPFIIDETPGRHRYILLMFKKELFYVGRPMSK